MRKIETIVRQEMNNAGAIELLMPVVQPAELWVESGRWEKYGAELLRIKDRHQRDFVLQPTSEEVITDIARNEIHSWRQLPVNFYHIQTKFRDERRPRFGLMRGREFTMKDAYSFDRDEISAQASYDAMYDAYMRIFSPALGWIFARLPPTPALSADRAAMNFRLLPIQAKTLSCITPTRNMPPISNWRSARLMAKRGAATEPLTKAATPERAQMRNRGGTARPPVNRHGQIHRTGHRPPDQTAWPNYGYCCCAATTS